MVVVAVEGAKGAGPIQIEVAEAARADVSEVYGDEETRDVREKVVKLARPLFAEAIDLVQSCAVLMKDKLDALPDGTRPDEFEMQFGVKLDAKVGATIVESSGGAQLQVSLRWKGSAGA